MLDKPERTAVRGSSASRRRSASTSTPRTTSRIALERISYPCALKPVHSHAFVRHFAGMKAFRVAQRRRHARRAVPHGRARDRDDRDRDHPRRRRPVLLLLHLHRRGGPAAPARHEAQAAPVPDLVRLRLLPHRPTGTRRSAELGLRFFEGVGPARARQRRVQARRARRPPEADRVQPPLHGGHRAAARGRADLPLFVYNKLTDRPLPPVDRLPHRASRCGTRCATCVRSSRTAATARSRSLPWLRSIMRRHHYPGRRACRTRGPCWRTTCACSAACAACSAARAPSAP